jgi:hypothetical protein
VPSAGRAVASTALKHEITFIAMELGLAAPFVRQTARRPCDIYLRNAKNPLNFIRY